MLARNAVIMILSMHAYILGTYLEHHHHGHHGNLHELLLEDVADDLSLRHMVLAIFMGAWVQPVFVHIHGLAKRCMQATIRPVHHNGHKDGQTFVRVVDPFVFSSLFCLLFDRSMYVQCSVLCMYTD